jgi:hypothetical protein
MIVTTQKELDDALRDNIRDITVDADESKSINIKDTGTSHVVVRGRTRVITCSGNVDRLTDEAKIGVVIGFARIGSVTGYAQITVIADSGRVTQVSDYAQVEYVYQSACIERVMGYGHVSEVVGRVKHVTDSASIDMVANDGQIDQVSQYGQIDRVEYRGCVGLVSDTASIRRVSGSARVERVSDFARVEQVTDSATIGHVSGSACINEATGVATIDRAVGTSVIHLHDHAQLIKASPHVSVFVHSVDATHSGGHIIDLTGLDLTDAHTWCEHYGVIIVDNAAVLYKAVREDWYSRHGISYQPGTIAHCDDFIADGLCGRGLHVSPNPYQAAQYDSEVCRYVEVHVDLKELNPIDHDKCKAPSVHCIREVDLFGNPI